MPDKKSISKHSEWLAYGKANGLLPNDNDQLALGGDIKGLKKNTPIPYDYLNNLSQINYFAEGGSLTELSGQTGEDEAAANKFSMITGLIGTGADAIEGNNDIYQNRGATTNKAIIGGVGKGLKTGATIGAQIGSVIPGGTLVGGAIGAGIGAIAGGINAKNNFQDSLTSFKDDTTAKYENNHPDTVKYFGAYGVELPEMGMGGDPVEFNGNTHEQGGLALGDNVEVEDGEIRVGNYVFSNRLVNPETGKTYATEAKKVTDKYKEYENDGPSMRSQNKMLEELKAKNDIAREQQKAIDAQKQEAMQTDHAAYGAMIQKDSKGSYVVDNSNKRLLMDNAKGHKMSYNTYLDSVYAYGGGIEDKLVPGGPPVQTSMMDSPIKYEDDYYPELYIDPLERNDGLSRIQRATDWNYNGGGPQRRSGGEGIPDYSYSENPEPVKLDNPERFYNEELPVMPSANNGPQPSPLQPSEFEFPRLNQLSARDKYLAEVKAYQNKIDAQNYSNALPEEAITESDVSNLEPMRGPNDPLDFVDAQGNPVYYSDASTRATALPESGNNDAIINNNNYRALDGSEITNGSQSRTQDKYARPNAALFASSLPAIDNLIQSSKKTNTKFNRVDLKDINMDQERADVSSAIARARTIQNQNVRGTATSSGDALAALSAGNAGLTGQETRVLSDINANERNANTQIRNQESMTNTDIANQEMIARQQDRDMRASVRNMALGNIGTNVQGNMRDKTAIDKNDAYNAQVMSLINSGEYKHVPDGKGGFSLVYIGGKDLPELQISKAKSSPAAKGNSKKPNNKI